MPISHFFFFTPPSVSECTLNTRTCHVSHQSVFAENSQYNPSVLIIVEPLFESLAPPTRSPSELHYTGWKNCQNPYPRGAEAKYRFSRYRIACSFCYAGDACNIMFVFPPLSLFCTGQYIALHTKTLD